MRKKVLKGESTCKCQTGKVPPTSTQVSSTAPPNLPSWMRLALFFLPLSLSFIHSFLPTPRPVPTVRRGTYQRTCVMRWARRRWGLAGKGRDGVSSLRSHDPPPPRRLIARYYGALRHGAHWGGWSGWSGGSGGRHIHTHTHTHRETERRCL